MALITLSDAGVRYRIDFKEDGKLSHESFWALRNVSASIEKGEAVALIGENGTGKSTLLKLISGVLKPDEGSVEVAGRAAGIMEIGGGLQPELTGTENIRMLFSLYGLPEKEAAARAPVVAEFAALGRFINAPVKSYSQGMLMRLAFSIAIHIDAGILLIDDTFSVGDAYAQKKCLDRIFELKEKGTTILCVSHDLETVTRLCRRGIFLRGGRVVMDGPVEKVVRFYTETVGERSGIAIVDSGNGCCVFNNGGVMFRWKGQSFTARPMESSFRLGGRAYFSPAARWEAQVSPDGRALTACGSWPERGIRQSWKIEAAGDSVFDISVSVESPEPPEVSETRVFLAPEFTRWSSLRDEHDFAGDFEFDSAWNISVVEDPYSRFMMAFGDAVPGFIIDRSADFSAECDAGNTGANIRARVFQFRKFGRGQRAAGTGWYGCFAARIRLVQPGGPMGPEREAALKGLSTFTRIERDPLTAGVSRGNFELSWRHKVVTAGCGLSLGFSDRQGNSYSIKDGVWEVSKTPDGGIEAVVKWLGNPSLAPMFLRFVPVEDGSLAVRVSMDSAWERVELQLCLNPAYGEWRTLYERGSLCGRQTVLLEEYINPLLGVSGEGLPAVMFSAGAGRFCSYVFRDACGVNLRFVAIPSRDGGPEQRGDTIALEGKVSLDDAGASEPLAVRPAPVRLRKGMLALEFAGGKGRLFWRGNELTAGLGIYTAFFFGGSSWIDSSQADWEYVLDGTTLRAEGRWPWVPFSQSWNFFLETERTVGFVVSYGATRSLPGLKAQVNVMLPPQYTGWRAARAAGRFPSGFIGHNGKFWERVWSGDAVAVSARARRGFLGGPPGVELRRGERDAGIFCVENTDDLFKSRVLQFEPRLGSAEPGSADLFRGTITVLNA